MSTVTDPRAVRSRQALRNALLKLLEVKPFEQITIRDITAQAGVGYTTFFRHQPTKEALLDDIAAEQITRLINLSMPVMDAHDLRAGSAALFAYVKAHRPLWSTLLTGGAAGTIRDEFLRQAREATVSRTPTDGWFPPDAGLILIVSGTIELLTWWLRQPNPPTVDEMAEFHEAVVVMPAIEASQRRPHKKRKK